MSGTTGISQTQSFLEANYFQDGQAAGSITPQRVRDLVASMPMPNIVKAPFRPNFPPYNAKFDGSTDDTAAWTAMFSDITTRTYGEVILPGGTSLVTPGSLNVPANCYIRGQGRRQSALARYGTGAGTVLQVSGTNQTTIKVNVCLQDFQVQGGASYTTAGLGPLVRMFYSGTNTLERVEFNGTMDAGLQLVQQWDSVFNSLTFINCAVNPSATAYTTSDEGGGTVVGSEALQILSATNATGFGYTTDSNNQLRFRDTQIETFCAGAIAVVSTTYNATGAYQIEFVNTKIETGASVAFTGKYIISESGATQATRFENTYMAIDNTTGTSGTNSGTQQFVYAAGSPGNIFKNTVVTQAASGFQSYIKTWGNSGLWIDGLTELSSVVPTVAALWVAGGTKPDWNDFHLYLSTLEVSPYYPPGRTSQYTSPRGLTTITGSATPGTALSSVPRTINQVTSVSGGAYFQLPAGATSPHSNECTVVNATTSTINIMPPTGGTVAGGAVNIAVTMAANTSRTFCSVSASAWY